MGSPIALTCYVCGAPAACVGRYEYRFDLDGWATDPGAALQGGCDVHCHHVNEDGWCCRIEDLTPEQLAEIRRTGLPPEARL